MISEMWRLVGARMMGHHRARMAHRPKSIYAVTCRCGSKLESETKETACPKCKITIRLEWPVRVKNT